MKTLYDRLDGQVIDKLNQDADKYPIIIDDIINDLKGNTSLDELKWGTVRYVHEYATGILTPFNHYKLFEIFGY